MPCMYSFFPEDHFRAGLSGEKGFGTDQRLPELESLNGTRVRDGLVLMIWGYFQSWSLRNRLAILTLRSVRGLQRIWLCRVVLAAAAFIYSCMLILTAIPISPEAWQRRWDLPDGKFRAPFLPKSIREYGNGGIFPLEYMAAGLYLYSPRQSERHSCVNTVI